MTETEQYGREVATRADWQRALVVKTFAALSAAERDGVRLLGFNSSLHTFDALDRALSAAPRGSSRVDKAFAAMREGVERRWIVITDGELSTAHLKALPSRSMVLSLLPIRGEQKALPIAFWRDTRAVQRLAQVTLD